MACAGKKISELEERLVKTGNETVIFQDGDYNGKMRLSTLLEGTQQGNVKATAHATDGDYAEAQVTVQSDNTLAFEFKLPRGKDGANGTDGDGKPGKEYRNVNAYKQSTLRPSTPSGGTWNPETDELILPEGWLIDINQEGIIWMSQCTFKSDGTKTDWSTPIRITGVDGENGKDGNGYEYIYKRTANENEIPSKPSWKDEDDYVPTDEGWFDNPQGVSLDMQTEWVCLRVKKDQKWGQWSDPSIWSKWGERGKDGDGYEYIFTLTANNNKPTRPTDSENEDEYIPKEPGGWENPWTDEPSGVSDLNRYEWVSMRKQKATESTNAVWGAWSEPALWATYSAPGKDAQTPDWKCTWFTKSDTKPEKPTNDNPYAPLPGEWVDSPTEEGSWWEVVGKVNGVTDKVTEWLEPFLISGVSFRNVTAFKSTGDSEEAPTKPEGGSWDPITNEVIYPEGWEPEQDLTGIVWQSQATFSSLGNIAKDWSEPFRITGENGRPGEDGKSREYIYKLVSSREEKVTNPTTNEDVDDYVPTSEGWSDRALGVSPEKPVCYWQYRIKEKGHWGDWGGKNKNEPTICSSWGENGLDGDGVEYVFVRTTKELKPHRPTQSEQVDDYRPPLNEADRDFVEWGDGKWTDNPTGVTPEIKFEYCSKRTSKNGNWLEFSEPALWSSYGKTGDKIEMRFKRNGDREVAPALDRSARNPEGWTTEVPSTTDGPYCWQIFAYINMDDELVGQWSYPICITGEKGETGGNGPGGVSGIGTLLRFSRGKESSYEATWNDTVKKTIEPASYGWSITTPAKSEEWPIIWYIQARIRQTENGGQFVDEGWDAPAKFTGETGPQGKPGQDGQDGAAGTDGVSVVSSDTYFKITKDRNTKPTVDSNLSGWSTTTLIPEGDEALWVLFQTKYSDGSKFQSEPQCISGTPGMDGNNGSGISKIEEQYYLSDSSTKLEGGSWETRDTVPDVPEGKFLWSSILITYGDGLQIRTLVVCVSNAAGTAGRNGWVIYPAGMYNPSKTYVNDGKSCPYVYDAKDGHYYYMNWVGSWTGTEQENKTPADSYSESGGDYWDLMEDFLAVYTNILIAQNGTIGSAVYSGDYMFSKTGIDGDKETTVKYENFDPEKPDYRDNEQTTATNEFYPNAYINYDSGKAFFRNLTVENAILGQISQKTKLFNKDQTGTYSVSQFEDCDTFISQNVLTQIALPYDEKYIGRTFTVSTTVEYCKVICSYSGYATPDEDHAVGPKIYSKITPNGTRAFSIGRNNFISFKLIRYSETELRYIVVSGVDDNKIFEIEYYCYLPSNVADLYPYTCNYSSKIYQPEEEIIYEHTKRFKNMYFTINIVSDLVAIFNFYLPVPPFFCYRIYLENEQTQWAWMYFTQLSTDKHTAYRPNDNIQYHFEIFSSYKPVYEGAQSVAISSIIYPDSVPMIVFNGTSQVRGNITYLLDKNIGTTVPLYFKITATVQDSGKVAYKAI